MRNLPAHDLKPGDVITLNGHAVEIYDAYPAGSGKWLLKYRGPKGLASERVDTDAPFKVEN